MKALVSSTFHRSEDLASDLQRMQCMLDSKRSLYGDILVQNGLCWKVVGLPVQEDLIAATKEWLYGLCLGFLAEVNVELGRLPNFVVTTYVGTDTRVRKVGRVLWRGGGLPNSSI